MPEEQLVISQSKLEEAHNTSNREWLETTFKKASQVIESGGIVKITQQFSDASMELVAIIDNLEGLNHYIKKYSP
jgi:ribosomal protein S20